MIGENLYIIFIFIFGIVSAVSLFVVIKTIKPYKEDILKNDEEKTTNVRFDTLKDAILENRLRRKIETVAKDNFKYISFLQKNFTSLFERVYSWASEKEHFYKMLFEKHKVKKKGYKHKKEIIDKKFNEITSTDTSRDTYLPDNELEQKYLEILSLDPKNIEAYEGLGEYYLNVGNYEYAKEIYMYLVKLDPRKIDYYLDLYLCFEKLDDLEGGFKILEKAYKIEPKNPKIIDKLINVSIIRNDKPIAKKYLIELEEVNPDNAKISEYKDVLQL